MMLRREELVCHGKGTGGACGQRGHVGVAQGRGKTEEQGRAQETRGLLVRLGGDSREVSKETRHPLFHLEPWQIVSEFPVEDGVEGGSALWKKSVFMPGAKSRLLCPRVEGPE